MNVLTSGSQPISLFSAVIGGAQDGHHDAYTAISIYHLA